MDLEGIEYDFDAKGSDWNYEPPRDELFRQLSAAVYTTDADGWLTYYNGAAAELWGHRPVLGKARWCGAWRLYRSDGTPLPHPESALALALRDGRTNRGLQAILERPDGARVPFIPYPTVLRNADGTIVAGSNVLLAIAYPVGAGGLSA